MVQAYMGVDEAALLYGMTKQAVNNRRNRGTMPPPVASLRMGHVWLTADLIAHRRLLEQQGRVFNAPPIETFAAPPMNDHPARVEEALELLDYAIGPHLPLPQVRQLIADAMALLKRPHPIEAQGSEPVGRTGSVVSNAIHDLWFAATIISSSTWGDGDKQKVRAALDRVEAALTRPDPSLGEPDEMTEDAIRSRAKALILKNGWKPGDKLGLHSVIELLAGFGMVISRHPERARCGFPDCGCDADARCNVALCSPSLGTEGVREALQPFADACPANDRLPDHDFVRLTHDGLLLTALRVADFRRAYQALASISTPGKGEG